MGLIIVLTPWTGLGIERVKACEELGCLLRKRGGVLVFFIWDVDNIQLVGRSFRLLSKAIIMEEKKDNGHFPFHDFVSLVN